MAIPFDFTFNQNNLQDYQDCPRRFQLRHVQHRLWPAVITEPIREHERHMLLGEQFHRLIQQHQTGLPLESLSCFVTDEELQRWWDNYLQLAPKDLPERREVEYSLAASLEGFKILAKYDLLAVQPGGKALIIDWKTSHRRPRRETLTQRMQTRIYPYLLACAGDHLNGGASIAPDQIEMRYWFAEFPTEPEIFRYSAEQFQRDQDLLGSLIREINRMNEADFMMTMDEKKCLFCNYRSLCNRGIHAGSEDELEFELEESGGLEIHPEQIAEVEF